MNPETLKTIKSELENEHPEFFSFIKTHGRTVLTGVLATLVIAVGARHLLSRGDRLANEAASLMAKAQRMEDLENVTARYSSTPSAPLALMSIAKGYFDRGDFDMALSKYIEFQSKYPQHPLAPSVELNRIICVESRGDLNDALAAYQAFASGHPDHFLTTEALFGKARCFEKMQRWQEAKAIYEDYMAANPGGSWFPRAEDALVIVDKNIKKSVSAE